jgi:PleD family two-component response regulator
MALDWTGILENYQPLPETQTAPEYTYPEEGIHVLLVEHDSYHQMALHNMLRWEMGAQVMIAEDLQSARWLLSGDDYDCVLLTQHLPDGDGLTLLRESGDSKIPKIMLTLEDNDHTTSLAIRHGAQDCLVMGSFDQRQLRRSIRHAIERAGVSQHMKARMRRLHDQLRDSSQSLDEANAQLRDLVMVDAETGMPNRRAFSHKMDSLIEEAWRGRRFAMTLGQFELLGDVHTRHRPQLEAELRANVGQWLAQQARTVDMVAVYDQKQFAILMVDIEERMACKVMQRMLDGLARNLYVDGDWEMSFGVVGFDCQRMRDGADLAEAAAEALDDAIAHPVEAVSSHLYGPDWAEEEEEDDDWSPPQSRL